MSLKNFLQRKLIFIPGLLKRYALLSKYFKFAGYSVKAVFTYPFRLKIYYTTLQSLKICFVKNKEKIKI